MIFRVTQSFRRSSMEKELRDALKSGSTKDAAAAVGKLVAETGSRKGVERCCV